ncbi:MAG TPA: metalloregulator ArsR/SmtB family transcription factor [Dehalococcoidia bacterium]|nr:metalloregulator ArsR/SmtB family transcription factor [Dehalococcoidia bacterium]
MLTFEAIADPTRRQILDLLREGEIAAGEVARHFPVSRPAVCKHLRVLRKAGLVQERRRGRHRLYRLNAAPLAEVGSWLSRYEVFWGERLAVLKRLAEEEEARKEQTPHE